MSDAVYCPDCKVPMQLREFLSMGPGYDEFESGGDEYRCPRCGEDFPVVDVYEQYGWDKYRPKKEFRFSGTFHKHHKKIR